MPSGFADWAASKSSMPVPDFGTSGRGTSDYARQPMAAPMSRFHPGARMPQMGGGMEGPKPQMLNQSPMAAMRGVRGPTMGTMPTTGGAMPGQPPRPDPALLQQQMRAKMAGAPGGGGMPPAGMPQDMARAQQQAQLKAKMAGAAGTPPMPARPTGMPPAQTKPAFDPRAQRPAMAMSRVPGLG